MCEDFVLNFVDKRTGCRFTTMHRLTLLFLPAKFYQKQHNCRLHTTYFCLFPQLKIKLKCGHFGTIEVIEAESQAVLNSLTEHDFRVHLNTAEALETVHTLGC
jgi:hypothetical protein